jgi:hypothetical protein
MTQGQVARMKRSGTRGKGDRREPLPRIALRSIRTLRAVAKYGNARIGFVSSTERDNMKFTAAGLFFGVLLTIATNAALAQNAEPSYKADPDVYKVIFEDNNFRVIEATRKKGVHDKPHGHPLPSVVYSLTDCDTKQYTPDGKSAENKRKAGTAFAAPITASHSAENIGAADCKQIFVEKK